MLRQFVRHVFLVLSLLSNWAPATGTNHDAVLLSDVKSLTFHEGKSTTHRRVPGMPQLNCIGGSARGLYTPAVMRCTNSGSSYTNSDVEWTCITSLPPEFKLGSTDVICEGYSGPEDEYVLRGSCALEYRLILTELGEEKYWDRVREQKVATEGHMSSIARKLFFIIFFFTAAFIIWGMIREGARGSSRPRFPRDWQGDGDGRDDGNDDPPPPYPPYPPYPPKRQREWTSLHSGANRESGWSSGRPGFWTGAVAGAAVAGTAGYIAGRRAETQNARRTDRQQPPARSPWALSNTSQESSTGNRRRDSDGISGSTRYESTGFGSTRRR